jgi:putative transposase
VLLRREGWIVNTKRVYRLYREEGLQVRVKKRTKRAAHARVPLPEAARPNQRWSMDFVSDRLADNRWFRILAVVDQYTRECLCIHADRSQTGEKVVEHMKRQERYPRSPFVARRREKRRWLRRITTSMTNVRLAE